MTILQYTKHALDLDQKGRKWQLCKMNKSRDLMYGIKMINIIMHAKKVFYMQSYT